MRISEFANKLGVSRIMPVLGILALCCLSELIAARGPGGSASLIPTAERQALIALYTSTNGDSWTDKTGWKTPPLDPDGFALPGTEAGWHGLTVDSGTQKVTGIDLTGNNLIGTIPAVLGDLTGLTDLNLSGNQLTGSIPAEIGSLTALQKIDLSYNQLTGSLPAMLGNLTALQRLYATNNQLSGSIPAELGNLPNLTYIYLNTNRLSGSIPPELGNMSSLRHLFLYSNELSGPIPPELGNAISLQSIVLRYNQLSGEIPAELGNLSNLLVLRLGDNQLTGEIPAELGNLADLQSLRLAHNHLSGEIPDTLGNLTQLWEIFLNSNQLTGPIPTSLSNLTGLTDTDIGYNALYTSGGALITFLNSKDPDWASTQTIAPTQVTATSLDNAAIIVSWLPVTYAADPGYYEVLISESPGGPYTLAGQTTDKTTSAVNVTGLTPGTRYYFVVRTVTNAHANNPNIVESTSSTEATAIAGLQTQVQISGAVRVGGAPLSGVVMSGLPDGTVTDAMGAYSAIVDVDFSGVVTPVLAGYTFDPLSRTYTNLTTNQTIQDYAATPVVVPTITVTSPNGGERLSVGSSHDITWTQTDLTGTVTIDLYKGGVYQKTLGTPDAAAGTFPWLIAADEVLGTDYTIRAWQSGGVSDDSDAAFAVISKAKVDFNNDGQEDILWRYHGAGEYQGLNVVWYLTRSETLPLNAGLAAAEGKSLLAAPSITASDPVVSIVGSATPVRTFKTVLEGGKATALDMTHVMNNPIDHPFGKTPVVRGHIRERDLKNVRVRTDAIGMSAAGPGPAEIAAIGLGTEVVFSQIPDTDWEIAGTGDFNGDGHTDILWRYYGTGDYQGLNDIWYMNGTTFLGENVFSRIADTNWRIDGTGDFNGDGQTDILWRYYGAGDYQGLVDIWYMNGAEFLGENVFSQVLDTAWRIGGTGDFNGDGQNDILWRYYGTGAYQGLVDIWYMNGSEFLGENVFTQVTDTAWEIAGTGDFNGDGETDILWRYYGTGAYQGLNDIWYMNGATFVSEEVFSAVPDTNWRIGNR